MMRYHHPTEFVLNGSAQIVPLIAVNMLCNGMDNEVFMETTRRLFYHAHMYRSMQRLWLFSFYVQHAVEAAIIV